MSSNRRWPGLDFGHRADSQDFSTERPSIPCRPFNVSIPDHLFDVIPFPPKGRHRCRSQLAPRRHHLHAFADSLSGLLALLRPPHNDDHASSSHVHGHFPDRRRGSGCQRRTYPPFGQELTFHLHPDLRPWSQSFLLWRYVPTQYRWWVTQGWQAVIHLVGCARQVFALSADQTVRRQAFTSTSNHLPRRFDGIVVQPPVLPGREGEEGQQEAILGLRVLSESEGEAHSPISLYDFVLTAKHPQIACGPGPTLPPDITLPPGPRTCK